MYSVHLQPAWPDYVFMKSRVELAVICMSEFVCFTKKTQFSNAEYGV